MKGIKTGCRVAAFVILFCLLLLRVQNLVTPNWDWPDFWGRTNKSINGFISEGKNTLDVLWMGTSHTQCGISPMYIYEQTGIRSYNLATSGQPLLLSYHRLKSALKQQAPKVVFLDASSCFYSSISNDIESRWLKTIHSFPMANLIEKTEMAMDMPMGSEETDKLSKTLSTVFPIMRFHSNYLPNEKAYLDLHLDKPYPQKGFAITTKIKSIVGYDEGLDAFSDSEGEEDENQAKESNAKALKRLKNKFNKNLDNLNKILELCRTNNCELVMMKMPVSSSTVGPDALWSPEKHRLVKLWCNKQKVAFLDMNDEDLGLDWQLDSCDGGKHLNLCGAEKVSQYFAKWLTEHYTFDSADQKTIDAWNGQLKVYNRERAIYNLQMIMEPGQYMDALKDGNFTVFSAICAPASGNWDSALEKKYRELTGTYYTLDTFWQLAPNMAYVSVSSNGELVDNKLYMDSAEVSGTLPDGTRYRVRGRGIDNDQTGSIVIGNMEVAVNGQGMCFVVYDNDMGSVVDSVLFNTQLANCPSKHGFNYERDFRMRLIEYENRLLTELEL